MLSNEMKRKWSARELRAAERASDGGDDDILYLIPKEAPTAPMCVCTFWNKF